MVPGASPTVLDTIRELEHELDANAAALDPVLEERLQIRLRRPAKRVELPPIVEDVNNERSRSVIEEGSSGLMVEVA